ncbi:hypothetical protein SSS_03760 [Sarcoptes scabiei]|nr:hypothetical protein SSS_03760 [Sarcoptes scabiei]
MSESNSDSVILKSPSFCSADTLKDLSHSTAMNQSNDPISLNVQKKDSNDQSIRENSLESDQNTSIRVESVIKSPVKLINPQTPVIKVIDTAKIENKNVDTQQNDTKAETNHDNKVETILVTQIFCNRFRIFSQIIPSYWLQVFIIQTITKTVKTIQRRVR